MDFSDIRMFSLLKTKLAYHAENQDILAQNVANSDTPGFQPKQLKELNFKRLALIESHRLQMKATSPTHLNGVRRSESFRVEEQRKTYEKKPVENAVVLEEQMAKVAFNQHEYNMAINLYRKTAQMMKTSIGNS